jgi:hypothetical protein
VSAGAALTLGAPAFATARWMSSDGAAWIEEATMERTTVATTAIIVVFGFEFMILGGLSTKFIFSNNLYPHGKFSMSWRHRGGAHN